MEPEPNRLFFALIPPQESLAGISATANALQQEHQFGGRLLNPQRYHITLFFFGDYTPPADEPAILEAAEAITAPPFELTLDKAGCFPNRDIATWLAPNETPPELDHLGQQLRKTVSHLSRERNSGFTPHLTISRQAVQKLRARTIAPITWSVTEFVLIRSILHQYPARYETLGRYPLAGAALPPQPKQEGFGF